MRVGRGHLLGRVDRQDEQEPEERADGIDGIDAGNADPGDGESAQGRADHARQLEIAAVPHHSVAQDGTGHEIREHRTARRPAERPAAAIDKEQQIHERQRLFEDHPAFFSAQRRERIQRMLARDERRDGGHGNVFEREDREPDRSERGEQLGEEEDASATEPVGCDPRGDGEKDDRERAHETHQPQRRLRMRALENLVAQRHPQHLPPEIGDEAADRVTAVSRKAKGRISVSLRGGGRRGVRRSVGHEQDKVAAGGAADKR
jgi:hypothetical protein